jgi:hypothetical protein
MSEFERESVDNDTESPSPYEAPLIEDLESSDGPAVTAAGVTKS